VYVIVDAPGPAVCGQNWPLTTPFPDQTPPAGNPDNATHGSVTQKGPIGVIDGTT
jgi:hypothetical protein